MITTTRETLDATFQYLRDLASSLRGSADENDHDTADELDATADLVEHLAPFFKTEAQRRESERGGRARELLQLERYERDDALKAIAAAERSRGRLLDVQEIYQIVVSCNNARARRARLKR